MLAHLMPSIIFICIIIYDTRRKVVFQKVKVVTFFPLDFLWKKVLVKIRRARVWGNTENYILRNKFNFFLKYFSDLPQFENGFLHNRKEVGLLFRTFSRKNSSNKSEILNMIKKHFHFSNIFYRNFAAKALLQKTIYFENSSIFREKPFRTSIQMN